MCIEHDNADKSYDYDSFSKHVHFKDVRVNRF